MGSPGRGRLIAGFVLLTVIWGTTWSVIRIGLRGVPPFTGVALRFALAGALLLALAPSLGVRLGRAPRERVIWLVNGVLSFCLSYSAVYWSEQYIPSGLAAVLFATYPLFVAVLAHFLIPGERLRRGAVAGLALGFAGVAVIFSDDLTLLGGEDGAARGPRHARLAARVGGGERGRQAVGRRCSSALARGRPDADRRRRDGGGGPPRRAGPPLVFDARSVGALLYLAVLGSAVTFTIYYWLLANMKATRLALMSYLIPIVAVAVGALLFDEPLRPRLLAGSSLVLTGVVIVSRRRHAPPDVDQP